MLPLTPMLEAVTFTHSAIALPLAMVNTIIKIILIIAHHISNIGNGSSHRLIDMVSEMQAG